jgi:hypothetical protein
MIYKLKYENKEAALKDLIAKEVINIEGENINGTEAVVECGIITLVYATETEDAIFAEGYHYDIMTSDEIVFESEIFVKNPKFKFAGE